MGAGCPWGSRVSCAGRERGKGSARAPLEASGEVCSGRSSRCAALRPLREARSPPGAAAGGSGCRTCPRSPATSTGPFSAGLLVQRSPNLVSPPFGVLVARTGRQQLASPARSHHDPGRRENVPKGCPGGQNVPKGCPGLCKGARCLPARGHLPPLLPVPHGPAITGRWDELGSERTEGAAPDVSLQKSHSQLCRRRPWSFCTFHHEALRPPRSCSAAGATGGV